MNRTKKRAADRLAENGISLPRDWAKLTTERAVAFVENRINFKNALSKEEAEPIPLKSKLLDRAKALVGMDKMARKNAKAKVYGDPSYVRTTGKTRRMLQAVKFVGLAVDPEVPTRQMLRRHEIEKSKQPLDMTQEAWHKLKGFGKVQPFGASIRQLRNKASRASRALEMQKILAGKAI